MLLTAAPFDAWTVKRYHIVMRIAEPNVCIPDVVTGVKVCCRCCLIDWLDLLAWTVGMTCCTVVHLSAVQNDLVTSWLLHCISVQLCCQNLCGWLAGSMQLSRSSL